MFSYIEVFAWLGSSHGFLSMIFGIFGKFWIDIGVQKISEILFRDKKYQKMFLRFKEILFGKFQISIRILGFSKRTKQYFLRKLFHLEKIYQTFSEHNKWFAPWSYLECSVYYVESWSKFVPFWNGFLKYSHLLAF